MTEDRLGSAPQPIKTFAQYVAVQEFVVRLNAEYSARRRRDPRTVTQPYHGRWMRAVEDKLLLEEARMAQFCRRRGVEKSEAFWQEKRRLSDWTTQS